MADVDISSWFGNANNNESNDLAFLLDEKAIEVLNFDLSDTAMNLEHTPTSNYDSNSSSEDEVNVHSSPVNNTEQVLFPGSPSSSDLSDLSPLINSWTDVSQFNLDASAFNELVNTFQIPITLDTLDVKGNVSLPVAEMSSTKEDDESRKTKKRRRGVAAEAQVPIEGFVELNEDDLLKFDSKQMETYIKNFNATRNVTPAQLKDLKRIRRLIKNREYAQSSRNKKKQYMEDIEKQLNDSKAETAALRQKLNETELENKSLKIQISKLGSALRSDPEIINRLQKIAKNIESPSTPRAAAATSSKKFTTFSATLFIVLFSFGLFFNFGGREPIPSYNTGRTLKSVSEGSANLVPYMLSFAPGPIQNVMYSLYGEFMEEPDEFSEPPIEYEMPIESPVQEEAKTTIEEVKRNESIVIVEPNNVKQEL